MDPGPRASGQGRWQERPARRHVSRRVALTLRLLGGQGHHPTTSTPRSGAKIAKGYPLVNTIFEDTRQAVLFQNGRESFRVPLSEPAKLADLLNAFYAHAKPDIESFKQAVEHFKERIPDLARALNERSTRPTRRTPNSRPPSPTSSSSASQSLNPNLRREAVDEMLVQHLLTERLFRTIFDNADFTRRNVIAAEIEQVIDALASQSFSRAEFLASSTTSTWRSRTPPAAWKTSATSSTSSTPSTSGSSRATRSRSPTPTASSTPRSRSSTSCAPASRRS